MSFDPTSSEDNQYCQYRRLSMYVGSSRTPEIISPVRVCYSEFRVKYAQVKIMIMLLLQLQRCVHPSQYIISYLHRTLPRH